MSAIGATLFSLKNNENDQNKERRHKMKNNLVIAVVVATLVYAWLTKHDMKDSEKIISSPFNGSSILPTPLSIE